MTDERFSEDEEDSVGEEEFSPSKRARTLEPTASLTGSFKRGDLETAQLW
jgi:hypothetical protein